MFSTFLYVFSYMPAGVNPGLRTWMMQKNDLFVLENGLIFEYAIFLKNN